MSRQSSILTAAAALVVAMAVPEAARAERTYRVQIESTPSGATVYIDSKDDGGKVGTTPYRGSLSDGEHTLILELDGYAVSETTIKVRKWRKRQKFRVTLTELITGTLEVSAASGDASIGGDVKVDGKKVGTVPDEFKIEVGPHQIEIVVGGERRYEEWIEVKAGETVTVEPDLGEAGDGFGDDGGGGGEDDVTPKVRKRAKPKPPRPTGNLPSAMFVFETGLDLAGRHFSYAGPTITENLRPYKADAVPGLYLGVELYPMAANPNSFAAKFGIDASFSRAIGLVSSTSDGNDVNTDWTQVSAGARVRHAVGGALLSVGVGYGVSTLEFEDPPPDIADQVPDASYKFTRIGIDGRIGPGAFSVFGGADLLLVGEAAGAAERFRDVTTTGFGARGGLAVRLVHQIEARATFRYRVFSSTYTAEAGDEFIAETSTDHQYGVLLGGAFIY